MSDNSNMLKVGKKARDNTSNADNNNNNNSSDSDSDSDSDDNTTINNGKSPTLAPWCDYDSDLKIDDNNDDRDRDEEI